jgi:SOS-response transcriptional repressor LexA
MSTLAERLVTARKHAKFESATDAARALGVAYPTYAGHENGSSGFRAKTGEVYARRFKVSFEWLMSGRGPMIPEPLPSDARDVPLLSWISAGAMMRDDVADEALGALKVASLPDGDWIALEVRGDSMDRISPPESRILVNRKDKQLVANACYVIDDGEGNATYKRYRPNPMRFEPVSTNPEHEPIYPDNEPVIVGRVRRSMIEM